jgi:hypothetical protein
MNIFSKIRWAIQDGIENIIVRCINKHGVQPFGYCPVQAEGFLATGETYYFRSRHSSWSVRIAKSEESLWDGGAWVYVEKKYDGYEGGWVSKLEVVRNFNKAIELYYEHTRSRENKTEVSQHGVSGQTSKVEETNSD